MLLCAHFIVLLTNVRESFICMFNEEISGASFPLFNSLIHSFTLNLTASDKFYVKMFYVYFLVFERHSFHPYPIRQFNSAIKKSKWKSFLFPHKHKA